MKFTIAIPSHNQVAFLPECLRSVIAQRSDGVDVEVLVYDGGSTDGSPAVIETFGDSLDYWQSEADGGQAAALASAFERATGDVLGWVNSDDVLAPQALSMVQSFLERWPHCPLIYGDAIWIDRTGHVLSLKKEINFDYGIFAYGYCYLPQPSTFFRMDAYRLGGGIDPTLDCLFDYDLWHRLALLGPVGHLPEILSAIRDHAETKTNTRHETFKREAVTVRTRYLGMKRAYPALHIYHRMRRVLRRARLGHYSRFGEKERIDWIATSADF